MRDSDGEPVVLSNGFLQRLLDSTGDAAEVKVALAVAMVWSRTDGRPVRVRQLLAADMLRSIVGSGSPEPAGSRLRRALDGATVNGMLLRLRVSRGDANDVLYLPNTAGNRRVVLQFEAGDEDAGEHLAIGPEDDVETYRPNAFALYERYIGPLAPLVAEQVRLAETSYPREWLERAMSDAAHAERRSWKYVETLLARWEREGPPKQLPTARNR